MTNDDACLSACPRLRVCTDDASCPQKEMTKAKLEEVDETKPTGDAAADADKSTDKKTGEGASPSACTVLCEC